VESFGNNIEYVVSIANEFIRYLSPNFVSYDERAKTLDKCNKYCEHTERHNDKESLPKFGKTVQVNLQCSILILWLPCRYGESLNSFCICCCISQPSLSSASVMLENYLMPQLQDHSIGP